MAQDVLERIRHAEVQAEQIKNDAKKQADDILARARQEAVVLIEEAKQQARAEAEIIIGTEERKAQHEAEEIHQQGRQKAGEVQKEVEAKLPRAVEFALKRVMMRS